MNLMSATEADQETHDPLLERLAAAGTGEERTRAIEELLAEHAYWRIDRILDAKFRRSSLAGHHRDDIRNEILLRLVHRLHQVDAQSDPLQSFAGYVAAVAYNTFDDFIRRAFPQRAKLKNRIRYALQHDERFAVWESHGALLCGVRAHDGQETVSGVTPAVNGSADLRDALAQLLLDARGPLDLETVVSKFQEVYGSANEAAMHDDARRSQQSTVDTIENVQLLRMLWEEICALPLTQRIALLLSARDRGGESVTRFLPITGVASVRQIGRTLSLDARELESLWEELPLEDTRIAVILQVTRQQVINLRRSARERLARRIRGSGQRK
jgi:hypothetical protein